MATTRFDLYPNGFDPVEYSVTHDPGTEDGKVPEVLVAADTMHEVGAFGSLVKALPKVKEARSTHYQQTSAA